ncbi:Maf family protein [Gracilibacillus caseinilyticus]
MQLILASSSPRRQQLLEQVGIPFKIRKQEVDESVITLKEPARKVEELARLKGNHVTLKDNNEVILSADTVVAYQHHIFEKPKTKEEAYSMIDSLSDSQHDVYTGVMLRSVKKTIVFVEKTAVQFWPISKKDIHTYIDTDEPYDKAGGYGIQSIGAKFVKGIVGDYYNVVGLPISRVVRSLQEFYQ